MSRSVGEPLALDAQKRFYGALWVIDAEGEPLIVAEIKFGEVAL